MKKLIAIPVIAVVAAFAAASAAGFAGGVSAAPLQTGQTSNLQCAASARVTEWGNDDSTSPAKVFNALVELSDSTCQGQAVYLIALKPDGTELARFASTRLPSTLASGKQYVRMDAPAGGFPTAELNAIRISVDGGYPNMPVAGSNSRY